MCINCIRSRVDITDGIPKQIVIYHCRGCERYLQPPSQWLPCALESKELLALILKRLKGLSKVRLVDACFLWTEPHSKRIKVKLTVQKEALAATILQQTFILEVVVGGQQCMDCARVEAKNTWNTVVQVRQKVDHKRTFLYLEQLILKHHAHQQVIRIRSQPDGLDFFFASRSHAIKLVEFFGAVVPVRSRSSEQLITQDTHSGDSTYKFTFSVEIVPICKDDLILLPPHVSRSLGGFGPLVLCMRVGTSLHLMDPNNLDQADLVTAQYWRDPFGSLASSRDLVEYFVLDVDEDYGSAQDPKKSKYLLTGVTVAKASEFGRSSQTFFARTHLGRILKAGDMVLGYDLSTANFNNEHYDAARLKHDFCDVILVRKSYAHLRRAGRKRAWKLQELDIMMDEDGNGETEQADVTMRSARKVDTLEVDRERFMEELEEDPELRGGINLYRDPNASTAAMVEPSADEEVPTVPLEELLEDLTLTD